MKLFFFVTCTLLCLTSQVFSIVVKTKNLELIEKEFKKLDANALVVFDVDQTLIIPKDRVLTPCGNEYLQNFLRNHPEISKEKSIDLESKVFIQSKVRLLDPHVVHLLEFLKKNNIKTIALTAVRTGSYGRIKNVEEWRIEQLNSQGIHFHHSFPQMKPFIFTEFQGKAPPGFNQGIICSSSVPKGKVLTAFLSRLQERPSKIIFIDDRIDYIESVESELAEEIPHVSFHYTAANELSLTLNEKLAEFQLNYLLQKEEWLSDEEAEKIMNEKL